LIFEEEGDRGNRKRLREFSGFTFAGGSEEFRMKLTYADTHLGWGDLVAICNVLAIDYTKKELSQRICGHLMDLNSLSNANKEAEDVKDDEEDIGDGNDDEDDTNANDDRNNNEDEDRDSNEGRTISEDEKRSGKNRKTTVRNKFAMTFRDVEDSIRLYNGDEKSGDTMDCGF